MPKPRFVIANRATEEFLDPRSLGERPVEGIFDRHDSNTMKALSILMCKHGESNSPLAGRWAGDAESIEAVDDTDDEYDLITENKGLSDFDDVDPDDDDEDGEEFDPDYPYPYLEVIDPDLSVEIEDTPFEPWMIEYASEFYSFDSLESLGLDT